MKKLEIGKIYKVEYVSKEFGKKDVFYGEYVGVAFDPYEGLPCLVCGAENHRRGHQFNSYYADDDMSYETFNIGTSCINECIITESTREEMLKN